MLRFVVNEQGHPALPGVDLDAPVVVIGSGASAQIRLPAAAAHAEHVRIEGTRWRALADVTVDGAPARAGTLDLARGTVFELGTYRVRVAEAPAGTAPSPPQRTESLARELMRSLLGDGAEPVLTIERGPNAGARRPLAPPASTLVIGRGDDADWVILDEDLSRRHVEIRRGWDGTLLVDLGSQNGTRVDGKRVTGELALRDGARIELGNLVLAFADPADRQLAARAPTPTPSSPPTPPRNTVPFVAALSIAIAAIVALVWILAS